MGTHKANDIAICPHCGHKQNMVVWAVTNGDTNTVTKNKIINGTFFNQTCKECGESFTVLYPTLYEDDTSHSMIYYAHTQMQESVAIQTVLQRRELVNEENDYAIRVTNTPDKFREKVNIANCGLDDRLIEIMKIALLEKLNNDGSLGHVNEVLCWCDKKDSDFELEIFCDRHCIVGVRKDFYKYLESKCKPTLDRKEPNPTIVDMTWAITFLEENHFKCI